MEKTQVVKRQQRFQEHFAALDSELRSLDKEIPTADDANTSIQEYAVASRRLELQYELGELCAKNGESELAIHYFERLVNKLKLPSVAKSSIVKGIEGGNQLDQQQVETTALHANVLNCLAVVHFRQGDHAKAMTLLLQAKQLHRESAAISTHASSVDTREADASLMETSLAANYAVFLHAKGQTQEAVQVARGVVEAPESANLLALNNSDCQTNDLEAKQIVEAKAADSAARSTAYTLLAICRREDSDGHTEALEFAQRAVSEADKSSDAEIQCRAHSNLGLFYFELGDSAAALPSFIAAFRAALHCSNLHLQAIAKYHIGVVLTHVDPEGMEEIDRDVLSHSESDEAPSLTGDKPEGSTSDQHDQEDATAVTSHGDTPEKHRTAATSAAADATATPARTPKDWFLQSESLAGALTEPDRRLGILAHGCRGEEEYHTSEFHTAEAEFTIALKRLKALLSESAGATGANDGANDEYSVTEPIDMAVAREMDPELAKLQGFLLSYLGCTLLVEGRFELAERSHQSDLALALEREDVFAQQRALRNLAMVFNCTQRYAEAIPMWRDALETAAVLQSKADQMMALSGLGTALKEYQLLKRTSNASAVPVVADAEEDAILLAPPLPVFLRQRALAAEIGDRHQQVLAQRHIVSVYESHTNESGDAQPDSGAGESAVEKWLAECDALVRLCEQYGNLQYRADAYRSLANAVNAQLARLRSRGAARFADAIAVLSHKRDAICAKYQEAMEELALGTAAIFQYSEEEEEDVMPLEVKERLPRAPVARVDVFTRR